MYSKIVVPLDGSEYSEQALPCAVMIARALSVPVELVEAFDVLPPAVRNRNSIQALNLMLEEAQRHSLHYLSSILARLESDGCSAYVTTLRGTPDRAIVAEATADPDALVVMATHGRSGISRWALGSVADKVLHTMPNPLLIIRPVADASSVPAPFRTVLAPLDGSELAELSLSHAVALASALDIPLSLLRVSHSADFYRSHLARTAPAAVRGAASGRMSAPALARADADEVNTYLDAVQDRLAAGGNDIAVTASHLQDDNVAQAITDQAEAQQSVVVMSTHGRSGISRAVWGSVTDRVVRHSGLPVMVIRN